MNNNSSFELKEITISDVFKKLPKVNVANATGHDNFPNKIVKIASPVLSKSLAALFTLSITISTFQMIGKLQRCFRFLNQINVMIQITLDRLLS